MGTAPAADTTFLLAFAAAFAGAFVVGGARAAVTGERRGWSWAKGFSRAIVNALGISALAVFLFPNIGCVGVPFWLGAPIAFVPGVVLSLTGWVSARALTNRALDLD